MRGLIESQNFYHNSAVMETLSRMSGESIRRVVRMHLLHPSQGILNRGFWGSWNPCLPPEVTRSPCFLTCQWRPSREPRLSLQAGMKHYSLILPRRGRYKPLNRMMQVRFRFLQCQKCIYLNFKNYSSSQESWRF